MTKYVICQQVKVEYQRPEWKWEDITIDFLCGLPRGRKGNDVVQVIVD